MKNLLLTLILLSPFSMLTGMEEDDTVEQTSVTIVCADEQQLAITSENFEMLKRVSKTIKTFTKYSTQKNMLPHPTITIKIFKKLISYLPNNPIYKENSLDYSKSEKENLIKKLMNEDIETLIPLLKSANYLDIAIFTNLLIQVLAKKFIQYDELEKFIQSPYYIDQLKLPEELSKTITSQIINISNTYLFVELNSMKAILNTTMKGHNHDDKWLVVQNGCDKYWYNLDTLRFFKNNISLKNTLLLQACFNENKTVSLNKHPHLHAYFRQLPKLIQKSLVENDMVELSFLQTLNYHNQTIIQIAVASTATIITLFNVMKEK